MGSVQTAANVRVLELARALADPLRLAILQHLMGGPAAVSELVSVTGAAQSNVSNHLALLRARGLVRATRQGRQVAYEVRDPSVGQLVESLTVLAGAAPPPARTSPPLVTARTCYDHLAGRLGVSLFDALTEAKAITAPSDGRVEVGPAGPELFGGLGIDVRSVRQERRRFATACLDWTERRPHLGGALGAALWARAFARGWMVRLPGTRAVVLTGAGRAAFRRHLGVRWPATGAPRQAGREPSASRRRRS